MGTARIEDTLGDTTRGDRLTATKHLVVILRLVVDARGNVSGGLVDKPNGPSLPFNGLDNLPTVVGTWLSKALNSPPGRDDQSNLLGDV
jgi:hypothetical protein